LENELYNSISMVTICKEFLRARCLKTGESQWATTLASYRGAPGTFSSRIGREPASFSGECKNRICPSLDPRTCTIFARQAVPRATSPGTLRHSNRARLCGQSGFTAPDPAVHGTKCPRAKGRRQASTTPVFFRAEEERFRIAGALSFPGCRVAQTEVPRGESSKRFIGLVVAVTAFSLSWRRLQKRSRAVGGFKLRAGVVPVSSDVAGGLHSARKWGAGS
jgi:hypothetical protein